MGHPSSKIKCEHNILDEFHDLLNQMAKIKAIKRIIPGRISRKQTGASDKRLTISYPTDSGVKCLMKKGSTAQELFVTCPTEQTANVTKKIKAITKRA